MAARSSTSWIKKAWFSNKETYPLFAVIGFAGVVLSVHGYRLFRHPDAHFDRTARKTPVRENLEYAAAHNDTIFRRTGLKGAKPIIVDQHQVPEVVRKQKPKDKEICVKWVGVDSFGWFKQSTLARFRGSHYDKLASNKQVRSKALDLAYNIEQDNITKFGNIDEDEQSLQDNNQLPIPSIPPPTPTRGTSSIIGTKRKSNGPPRRHLTRAALESSNLGFTEQQIKFVLSFNYVHASKKKKSSSHKKKDPLTLTPVKKKLKTDDPSPFSLEDETSTESDTEHEGVETKEHHSTNIHNNNNSNYNTDHNNSLPQYAMSMDDDATESEAEPEDAAIGPLQ